MSQIKCPSCGGSGLTGRYLEECEDCDGVGKVLGSVREEAQVREGEFPVKEAWDYVRATYSSEHVYKHWSSGCSESYFIDGARWMFERLSKGGG